MCVCVGGGGGGVTMSFIFCLSSQLVLSFLTLRKERVFGK